MIKILGNVICLVEDKPLSKFKPHKYCCVFYAGQLYAMSSSICSGWEGTPDNKTYCNATMVEMNDTNTFHTSVTSCYKVVAIQSEKISKRFGIKSLSNTEVRVLQKILIMEKILNQPKKELNIVFEL